MGGESSKSPFGRIVLTGLVIVLLSVVIITLVVTGYAVCLGFQARGAPDRARIEHFAQWMSSILSPFLGILLTFLGARSVRKRAPGAHSLSGLMLGLVVVVLSVLVDFAFGTVFRLIDLLWFVLILLAGWIGGRGAPPASPFARLKRRG